MLSHGEGLHSSTLEMKTLFVYLFFNSIHILFLAFECRVANSSFIMVWKVFAPLFFVLCFCHKDVLWLPLYIVVPSENLCTFSYEQMTHKHKYDNYQSCPRSLDTWSSIWLWAELAKNRGIFNFAITSG